MGTAFFYLPWAPPIISAALIGCIAQDTICLSHSVLRCTCAKSYPFVQFKYSVYGRTGHLHASRNAVTLVWGSLRLTPITETTYTSTVSQQSTNRTSSNMAEGPDPGRGLVDCEFTIRMENVKCHQKFSMCFRTDRFQSPSLSVIISPRDGESDPYQDWFGLASDTTCVEIDFIWSFFFTSH